jgi:hypothetical protein
MIKANKELLLKNVVNNRKQIILQKNVVNNRKQIILQSSLRHYVPS